MRVQSLYLYPVKSLAGIEVSSFNLDEFGPAGDRRWMLVNDGGEFVTQRQLPMLATIRTCLDGRAVKVFIPGEGPFDLVPGKEPVSVGVWQDRVDALVGTGMVNPAVSRYCGQNLRFVYMPDDSFRRVDPERVPGWKRVGFADGFPFLVTNQSSLDELNARLDKPVDMRHFRANIVVSGAEPWAEDGWHSLVIGTARFLVAKPCSRCVMTTVDPDSGNRHPQIEPLRTLSTYRKTSNGVIFGQNAIHLDGHRLSVGDTVTLSQQEL
ncbi:MOSC N-terminal beta barrel domain-containing protein [Marinobacter sp.]|uniref:MOSC domain-containing protein n=1 Tax=Marinobacter sp. TaxID=50741 RepID=UPI0019ECAC08|nr:MOSC N-terminal beta barrel domain-containing protein [Marinobacter sp.]MBE0485117.1 MOSC domain-containing protein [Marinobacter sp.]